MIVELDILIFILMVIDILIFMFGTDPICRGLLEKILQVCITSIFLR